MRNEGPSVSSTNQFWTVCRDKPGFFQNAVKLAECQFYCKHVNMDGNFSSKFYPPNTLIVMTLLHDIWCLGKDHPNKIAHFVLFISSWLFSFLIDILSHLPFSPCLASPAPERNLFLFHLFQLFSGLLILVPGVAHISFDLIHLLQLFFNREDINRKVNVYFRYCLN